MYISQIIMRCGKLTECIWYKSQIINKWGLKKGGWSFFINDVDIIYKKFEEDSMQPPTNYKISGSVI